MLKFVFLRNYFLIINDLITIIIFIIVVLHKYNTKMTFLMLYNYTLYYIICFILQVVIRNYNIDYTYINLRFLYYHRSYTTSSYLI